MQKASTTTVSAGLTAPAVIGPDRGMKDVYILSGLVFFLAVVVAALWYYSQADETAHSSRSAEALNSIQGSQILQDSTDSVPVSAAIPTTHVDATPVATRSMDILHDDIHFEIGRKGLTDDGKAALQRHAEFLKNERDWGILLQGYTDQQGSKSFNKILGMKRAETVKQQLILLGVPESAIRTVSLGEEGALCIDNSDVCRQMNRRVHLEMWRVGREHMTVLPVPAEPMSAPFSDDLDPSIPMPQTDAGSESLSPSPADEAEFTSELATGN